MKNFEKLTAKEEELMAVNFSKFFMFFLNMTTNVN